MENRFESLDDARRFAAENLCDVCVLWGGAEDECQVDCEWRFVPHPDDPSCFRIVAR